MSFTFHIARPNRSNRCTPMIRPDGHQNQLYDGQIFQP